MRFRWLRVLLVGIVVIVAAVAGYAGGRIGSRSGAPAVTVDARNTAPVAVRRADVRVSTTVSGSLSHAPADRPLVNQVAGVVTAEAAPETVCQSGCILYDVSGLHVYLAIGSMPMYRTIAVGSSGPDVAEVKATLAILAGNSGVGSGSTYTQADANAVRAWQRAHGYGTADGSIPLGEFVAAPAPVRVAGAKAAIGQAVGPGQEILEVTSPQRTVVASIDAGIASALGPQAKVTVAIGSTRVGGTVSGFASPSTTPQQPSNPNTIAVTIALDGDTALPEPDGTPVQVSVVTQHADGVLAVPISALLALAGGGYGLELAPTGNVGAGRLVAVSVGLIDAQQGLAEVSGAGIREGAMVLGAAP